MTAPGGSSRGPGILETGLVLGGALLVAAVILVFFAGPLGELVGAIVDAAHGGR